MMHARQPARAEAFCRELEAGPAAAAPCLREADEAGLLVQEEGWDERPSWPMLLAGARPIRRESWQGEGENTAEPGEWQHGWQFSASSVRETRFRERALLSLMSDTDQAMLRSNSGPGAGYWLTALPVSSASSMRPALFQVALRRRLRLKLLLGARRCPGRCCRRNLDALGDHLAACSRSGLLQRRAVPLERAWRRVLREAGARIVPQQLLRDMDVALQSAEDGRRLDVVAYGLQVYGGVPICGDATMVSPLHSDGTPWRGAPASNGLRLRAARRRKEVVYPELVAGASGRLVLLGCEIGGRWAPEALELLRRLARQRCSQAPSLLRRAATFAWHRRWLCHLGVAAQTALAASLAEPTALLAAGPDASPPEADEVLCGVRLVPPCSCLPLR